MPATLQPSAPAGFSLRRFPGADGRGRQTALAIARVEGRRLILHPLMLVALVLAAIYAWAVFKDLAPVMARDTVYLAGSSAPIALAGFVAAHLATGRPRHDGTEDLHEASPAQAATRTAGLLLAALGPAAGSLAFVLAWTGYLYAVGGIGHPYVFELLAAPALAGTACVAGVAVGRWAPSRIIGPLAAVVAFAGQGLLLYPWFDGGPNLVRLMLHTDWGTGLPPELLPRSPGLHLVYVLGVALAIAAVALARHRQGQTATVLAAVGLSVAAVTGAWLAQPPSAASVEQAVTLTVDPTAAFECQTRDAVEYCVLPRYVPWIDRWHDTIGSVLAALPDADRPERLRVEMTLEDSADYLGEVLYAYLDDTHVSRLVAGDTSRQQALRVGTELGGPTGDLEDFALALTVSSLTVDIGGPVVVTRPEATVEQASVPVGGREPDEPHLRCSPIGQAREVLALYLAAQSSPSAERGFHQHLQRPPLDQAAGSSDAVVQRDRLRIEPRLAEAGGNRYETLDTPWSRTGAVLAAQLLERASTVERLHADWALWTDPTTPVQQLTERLALAPASDQPADELGLPACR